MQTTAKHGIRMDQQHHLLNWINYVTLSVNALLGVVLAEHINLIVAASGALVTIVANLDRVFISIARINQLRKNGWKLPQQYSINEPPPTKDPEQ